MSSATEQRRAPGEHYSLGIRVGDFVFMSGQVPRDHNRNVIGATIEKQTAVTLENIKRVLLPHQVGRPLFTFPIWRMRRASIRPMPATFRIEKPLRTVVGGQLDGMLVELGVVASLGKVEEMPGETQ
jgi:2-iminobutanoate/2-iminopropanoate deaminase